MIKDFAEDFWRRRAAATDGTIRWTQDAMLRHDVALLESVVRDGDDLLDVGAGTGDMFVPLLDRLGHVTAVDMVPDFLERIPGGDRVERVVSELTAFRPRRVYDIATMFGVVTHLPLEDENAVYALLRAAAPEGTVIVKNQCSTGTELLVDRHSEAFGGRYVGRYPGIEEQAARLRAVFGEVDVRPYPEELNRWPDSAHVAFVCRGAAG